MLPNLSSRLLLTHLLVAAVAISLAGVLSSQLFRHFYVQRHQQFLAATTEELAATVGRLMTRPDGDEAIALVTRTTSQSLGGRVCVFSASQGEMVASSDLKPDALLGPDTDALLCEQLAAGLLDEPRALCYPGPVISVAAPILEPGTGRHLGAVLVRRSLSDVRATLRMQSYLVGLSGALAAALALVLALLVSRAIAHPLRDMVRVASDLAEGNFDVNLERRGPLELRTLAAGLNHMAARLRAAFSDLSAERERLADILACMEEGVMRLDAEGRVEAANESAGRLLGLPVQDLRGSGPEGWLPEPAAEELKAVLEALAEADGERAERLVTLQDRTLRVHASTAPGGGAVLVMADVTEAERLEHLRREFVANASHELRAPLTSIQGFLGAMTDGTASTEEERARCLRVASEQAALMRSLVEQLLDLSRLQAHAVTFEVQQVDLSRLIHATVEALSPQAAAGDVRFSVHLDDLPAVPADGDRLMQVLLNLLDNAIRFSPRGGEVEVAVRKVAAGEAGETWAEVSVRDHGPGIPPADLPLIWERFHKADRSRTRAGVGAGLGLTIAREIIIGHGGTVSAANAPDGGAVLSFSLPCSGAEPGSASTL